MNNSATVELRLTAKSIFAKSWARVAASGKAASISRACSKYRNVASTVSRKMKLRIARRYREEKVSLNPPMMVPPRGCSAARCSTWLCRMAQCSKRRIRTTETTNSAAEISSRLGIPIRGAAMVTAGPARAPRLPPAAITP
jgi:hypothetical protein